MLEEILCVIMRHIEEIRENIFPDEIVFVEQGVIDIYLQIALSQNQDANVILFRDNGHLDHHHVSKPGTKSHHHRGRHAN